MLDSQLWKPARRPRLLKSEPVDNWPELPPDHLLVKLERIAFIVELFTLRRGRQAKPVRSECIQDMRELRRTRTVSFVNNQDQRLRSTRQFGKALSGGIDDAHKGS